MVLKERILLAALCAVMSLLGGALACVFMMKGNVAHAEAAGQAKDEIIAQRFKVVDKDGAVRGVFGDQGFAFVDAQGKYRAMLGVDREGKVILTLNDTKGNPRCAFVVAKDGTPTFALGDAQGGNPVVLQVKEDGTPNMLMGDARGKNRIGIGVPKDGPAISLMDRNGQPTIGLVVPPDDKGSIVLNGKPVER